jgi:hypothetical protein
MALDMMVDVMDAASSPETEFSFTAQGRNFPTEPLTSNESELLQSQLNTLVASLDSSMLSSLLKQRQDTIAHAAAFAKQEFDEKLFGGVNAGDNEIGFDTLRPGHIRSDPSTGSAENDWYFDPAGTGWVDWIGDGSTNNFQANEDQIVLVLGFMDQDVSTEVSGINVEEFGRNVDMLPIDTNSMRLRDNDTEQQLTALPSLIIQENEEAHIRLRYDQDVESQPRLFGFTFGLGTYLNTEDF